MRDAIPKPFFAAVELVLDAESVETASRYVQNQFESSPIRCFEANVTPFARFAGPDIGMQRHERVSRLERAQSDRKLEGFIAVQAGKVRGAGFEGTLDDARCPALDGARRQRWDGKSLERHQGRPPCCTPGIMGGYHIEGSGLAQAASKRNSGMDDAPDARQNEGA